MNQTIKQAKILIIDDEPMAADVLCRILENEGFQHFETVNDPSHAMARFREFQPDVVVLDWMMPELSGAQVLAQLRAEIPRRTHLPILVVTALPHLETRHEALTNGATDFLTKPYNSPEIVLRISNLLETRFLHLAVEEQNRLLQIRVEEGAAELTKANAALAAGLIERELVKEESVLRIAEEWEQSFDAVPDHVCILDMEGKILRANRAMRAQFEPVHGPLTGVDYRLCYCGAATSEEQPGCAETASGRPTVWEGKVQSLEGWFWIATYPLTEEGVQWGTVSVACDMTWRKEADDALQEAPAKLEAQVQERTQELEAANSELSRVNVVQKSVEDALRLSEEQLKTAVFGADLGTWDWEIASGKLICSARTEEMFGLVDGTLNNVKAFESAVHPEDRTRVRRALEETIKTHGAYQINHRVIWPDGIVRWVAARGGVRTDAAGNSTHVTGTVYDITARKHDEAKEVLRAAERAAVALLGQGALLRTDIQTLFDQAVVLV
ncbi:MAG: response regulator, partial [Verrucomicrobiaceae bacterium]|nr:response regulator [Verrucomicrobiaceae bacterium]